MEEEEIEEYNQYGDWNSHLEVEIEHQHPKKQPLHGGDIKDFVQSANNHRAFVSRGDIVNLYKYDDDTENFAYVTDLPRFEYRGEKPAPSKIQLQEQDSKLSFIDSEHKDKVYYYDVEKSKVINEFQPDKKINIRAISISGGKMPT